VPVLLLACALSLSAPASGLPAVAARRATDFLDSIGANSAISRRGESLVKTIECARYLGLRWFRSGYENDLPVADLIELHRQTGARVSWGLLSGGSDLDRLTRTGKELARAGALLAFEGPNEPNNWGIAYQGKTGGRSESWQPVAALQRDLYRAVHDDPALRRYPVWGISEVGAQVDNVGLQFLTVPKDSGAEVSAGTRYADFANVHNYVYHPNSPGLEDNKTWNAADPTSACKVDGLYGNHGLTWGRHFRGYSERDLRTLPRVTTETGCTIDGPVTEEVHALNLLSLYLDQFKRGWSHTAVYLLRDRSDEAGNQRFGFYGPDYRPRKAARYLHNLTAILADRRPIGRVGKLAYAIPNLPATVHDLLLQKGDGTFALVVWSELVRGTNRVEVRFDAPPATARVYDPTVGTAPLETQRNPASISLALTDHPVVIELPPARRPGA
jgi:hypothetical protein